MYNVRKVYENELRDDGVKNYSQLQISKSDISAISSELFKL